MTSFDGVVRALRCLGEITSHVDCVQTTVCVGFRFPVSTGREEVETRKSGRNETRTFQGLFPGCTRVNKKPAKEPDINVSFPMKPAWQADCMFLFLRWKRNTWISKVSFGFRFNSTPQSKCSSRDYSEDQPGSRFSWCDNGSFDRKWSSRSNTWGSSTTVRDLPLFSAY